MDVPLRVVAVDPSDAGLGVERTAVFTVTFSEPVDPVTALEPGHFAVTHLGEGDTDPAAPEAVAGALSLDESGTRVTFTPAARLAYSARYRLVVARGVTRLRDGARLPAEGRAAAPSRPR